MPESVLSARSCFPCVQRAVPFRGQATEAPVASSLPVAAGLAPARRGRGSRRVAALRSSAQARRQPGIRDKRVWPPAAAPAIRQARACQAAPPAPWCRRAGPAWEHRPQAARRARTTRRQYPVRERWKAWIWQDLKAIHRQAGICPRTTDRDSRPPAAARGAQTVSVPLAVPAEWKNP